MIDPRDLEQRITQALPGAQVAVEDLTGGGDHYKVQVISDKFEGVSKVQRHRMVYAPLRDMLGDGALHALALSTQTPQEAA